jgi:hypothetical protein
MNLVTANGYYPIRALACGWVPVLPNHTY